MTEPDVSPPKARIDVVIVSHASADHLQEAIAGLPPDAAVVVIDNASNDDSVVVARATGARVVAGTVNAGFGAGADRGARLGDAPVILFLNPDAVVTPALVDGLVEAFARQPDLGAAGPPLVDAGGCPQQEVWPLPSPRGAWLAAVGLGRDGHAGTDADGTVADGFVVGACLAVRRVAYEEVGGFDGRFWLYGEETDLERRLQARGWRLAQLGTLPPAQHLGGGSDLDGSPLVLEHFWRGPEHVIDASRSTGTPQARRAVASFRLATLVGSTIRSLGPPGPRRDWHRARRRRLLRVLRSTPTSVPLDSPATRAPGRGVVVCSLERWDEVWRRNQLLVEALLAADPDLRVLWVEPAFDHLHEARRRVGRRRIHGLRPVPGHGRVTLVEPGKLWPRLIGPFADRSLHRQVRRAVHNLGFVDPTLWVNDLSYAGLPTRSGWPSLLDVTDDWSSSGDAHVASSARRQEAVLLGEVDRVVVCAEALAADRRPARPDVVVIPNAVDSRHLRRPRPRPADLPAERCAVYLGTLHEDRLDVGLVAELSEALRADGARVVLVGPDSLTPASRSTLDDAGVLRLGARPYADAPAYLQHAAVVLVPHVVGPFTEGLDPLKAHECLALGRVTVSTPVAGLRDAGDPVVVADRHDFVSTTRAALADPPPDRPQDVPDWHRRATDFADQLDQARVEHRPGRLRAVVVDHCAEVSGAEIALARLVPALRRHGVDVHVVLGAEGPLLPRLEAAGAAVTVLPLDPSVASTSRAEITARGVGTARAVGALRAVVDLVRLLRRLDADVVVTNSLKAALYGGLAGRLARRPVVVHLRDRISDDDLPAVAVPVVRSLVRAVADVVVANSSATAATLGTASRAHPVVVVHDAVEPAGDDVPSAAVWRAELGDGVCRIAMVGRLAPWKGQHVLLAALALLDGDVLAGVHVSIVGTAMFGEDDYAESLRATVTALDLERTVSLPGFVDDIPGLLADVDIVVHCSVLPEPFGQVVIEGMAAGCAVIASDAGGPAEIITSDADGLLVTPDDPGALAAALQALIVDPARRARLGDAGRTRVRSLTPDLVAGRVAAAWRRVARQPRRGRASRSR